MVSNLFFEKKGPYPLKEIIEIIDCSNIRSNTKDFEIHGVESLVDAKENDMTFLNSSMYRNASLKTKAVACITSPNLSKFLPDKCIKLNVKKRFVCCEPSFKNVLSKSRHRLSRIKSSKF